MPAHQLIVVNGPIASGKSTLARALGETLRQQGERAAVIDLDLLYEMLDHRPKADSATWAQARRAAAALATAFFASGVETVMVEGSFRDAAERGPLLDALPADVEPRFVTLAVPFSEALRRARGDPTRGLSRDPAFLAREHARFTAAFDPARGGDLVLDTTAGPPAQLVRAILRWRRTGAAPPAH